MEDISNKTLAILAGIAIIISAIGILSIPKGGVTIIGEAVSTNSSGIANVSIQSLTQITLVNNTIDFGAGFVNTTDVACILESNNSQRMNSTYGTRHPCANSSGGIGFNAPARSANFVIANTGNVNVSLTVNGSFKNATAFLCSPGTLGQGCGAFTPEYNWSAANLLSGSCTSFANSTGGAGQGSAATGFIFPMNSTSPGRLLCNSFNFSSGGNQIQIALHLVIPQDSFRGLRQDNITFEATGP